MVVVSRAKSNDPVKPKRKHKKDLRDSYEKILDRGLLLVTIAVVVYVVIFALSSLQRMHQAPLSPSTRLISQAQLDRTQGLMLVVLGEVYDVQTGEEHYGGNSGYSVFIRKVGMK